MFCHFAPWSRVLLIALPLFLLPCPWLHQPNLKSEMHLLSRFTLDRQMEAVGKRRDQVLAARFCQRVCSSRNKKKISIEFSCSPHGALCLHISLEELYGSRVKEKARKYSDLDLCDQQSLPFRIFVPFIVTNSPSNDAIATKPPERVSMV